MRRVFAILMVMILIIPAAVSADTVTRKEYYGSVYNETKGIIESIIAFYDDDPGGFDADYIVMAYGYLTTYLSLRRVDIIEKLYDLKSDGKVMVREFMDGMQLSQESGYAVIEKALSEKFYKWAKGEMEDAEFAEIVIDMCRNFTKEVEVPQT